MQEWEHHSVYVRWSAGGKDMQAAVDRASTEGWELVAAVPETTLGSTVGVLLLFKRPASSVNSAEPLTRIIHEPSR